MYTYPAPPVQVTGPSTIQIHTMLQSPPTIAKRLRTLLDQKYISDVLLKGRFVAKGGAILYETGEEIFPEDEPEAVAPGGGYPQTRMTGGDLAAARTSKWGQDSPVTDEAIGRLGINPVDRAFTKLVNQSVKFVDSASLGVIASKLTRQYDVSAVDGPGVWTGESAGDKIVEGVLLAVAEVTSLDEGYSPDTVVLKPRQWAKAIARLNAAGLLPREAGNPLISGVWPQALGLTWLTSNHTPVADPMIIDTEQLGGMADEDLGGPNYVKTGGVGVETKSIRDEDNDSYKLRARRTTVPVVLEPNAGVVIKGTGL